MLKLRGAISIEIVRMLRRMPANKWMGALDICERLGPKMPRARSIYSILQNLHKRGFVLRRKSREGVYEYRAAPERPASGAAPARGKSADAG